MKPVDPHPGQSDERLVRACLAGNEDAWSALVDKYKNLVFAIILRAGISREEATDLFQTVWLEAYSDLPGLRRKEAFKPWLSSLTQHKCYHLKQKLYKQMTREAEPLEPDRAPEAAVIPPDFADELERDQLVREALFSLPRRCREMVHMLFFTSPPVPYKEVAERLGLATGSIGFIRGRCLERLRKTLEALGLS